MRLIDANTIVTCLIYDDEYEERFEKAMTIADYLDEFSNEGCPPTIEAVPVRKGENLSFRTDHDVHNYQTDGKRGRVMIDEWSGTLTLTEASSRELMRVLEKQDAEFMDALFNGECGFTLKCADGRSVELVPNTNKRCQCVGSVGADRKTENSSEKPNNSTISKMEQVDKDINVRSKDESQTERSEKP